MVSANKGMMDALLIILAQTFSKQNRVYLPLSAKTFSIFKKLSAMLLDV